MLCFRAGVPPFLSARDALSLHPHILALCHSVPLEVVNLKTGILPRLCTLDITHVLTTDFYKFAIEVDFLRKYF